jgi:hypothetical protein
MTQYAGDWPAQLKSEDDNHHWTIDVYRGRNPKVAAAYAHAKDGYEADLDEFVDFLIPPSPPPPGYFKPPHALAYFFARFERKHFDWGNAVSFSARAYKILRCLHLKTVTFFTRSGERQRTGATQS